MKKTLIYHLYVNDTVFDNKNYIIHKECLKHYIHVFEKIIFYISIEDYVDNLIITDAVSWVNDICKGKEHVIKIRKATTLCESECFKEEIINNIDSHKDEFIFLGHSKNVTRLHKDLSLISKSGYNGCDVIPQSIIKWAVANYFYNLNFIDEMERKLNGCPLPTELFYGSFLTSPNISFYENKFSNNIGNCMYLGSFYWINANGFKNYIKKYPNSLPEVNDRYFFENFPGVIGGYGQYGNGCASHNNVVITDDFDLYKMNEEEWEYLIHILGDKEEFWWFYNEIMFKSDIEYEKSIGL